MTCCSEGWLCGEDVVCCCLLFVGESERDRSAVDGSSVTTCPSAVAVESTTFGLSLVGDGFEIDEDGMGYPAGIMLRGLIIGG